MNEPDKDRIGNYELLELIGDGAQGKVFKARCVAGDSASVARDAMVAVKILRVAPDDEQAHTRFQTQADILKNLAHPHIIRYWDSFTWHPGEWDEAQCLVVEFLEGETLAARLKSRPRGLSWPEVKAIFEQCLSGLLHAQQQGIIHRDLKPSNIFLTQDGTVKIFDFDIARLESDSQRSTVGWKGSFDYMAPDFVTEPDFHGDEISDIFSLGICVYQALTGKLPFEPLGESAHIGYLNRWRNAQTPAVLSFRSGVFHVLANVKPFLSQCLSPQRAQRYPSFSEMLTDFQKIHYRVVQHKGKDTYELREVLGRGGFGEVFKGVRQSDGQPVAIKHLFAARQSRRFIKEAKMLQRYSHPFLVKYIDFVEVQSATRENQYFLVLELLEGMPEAGLRYRIKKEGKLEPAEAIPLFMNYLEALSFLHGHSRPLIHRDIKPMNLYAPAGHPEKGKIFDLGVARDVSGTVTSGGIPGTLDYMAPEFVHAGADRGAPQSDIYSLGLCCYEALTGQTAFSRFPPDINSSWLLFQERAQKMPEVNYHARVFRLYPDLKAVIQKAIAREPRERYATAAEMRQDLEKVLGRLGQPEDAPLPEEPTTIAASSLPGSNMAAPVFHPSDETPIMGLRRQLAPDASRRALEESMGPPWPDLPDFDIAGAPAAVTEDRRKRALRAAVVILVITFVGAGTMLWWSRVGGGLKTKSAPSGTPPQPSAAVPSDVRTLHPSPSTPPMPASRPAEPDRIRAAREELEQAAAQNAAMEQTLSPYRLNATVTNIARRIPASLSGALDIEQANQAAEDIELALKQNWPGISAAEKRARLDPIRAALAAKMSAWIASWHDEAMAQYQAGKNGEPQATALMSLMDEAPAAVALTGSRYQESLQSVEAARKDWEQMTLRQRMLLKAIEAGSDPYDRSVVMDQPIERERLMDLLSAAIRAQKGFNVLSLLDSEESSRVFLASVADFWKKASRCEGPLGDAIRDSAWANIHRQLVIHGEQLLKPADLMMAGVRTPEQQARLRREYLRLLAQIETVTGRVSGCREDDPLHAQVSLYFRKPYFHPALIEDRTVADNIPWLSDEFRKACDQP